MMATSDFAYEYSSLPCFTRTDEECQDCPNGTLPNANFSFCQPIPEEFLNYGDTFVIIAASIASAGMLGQIHLSSLLLPLYQQVC